MRVPEPICRLQQEKLRAFQGLELATLQLLSCGEDSLPEQMQEREAIISRIKEVDQQLCSLLEQEEPGIASTLQNNCERETLAPEQQALYDTGLEIRAAACRTHELEQQVILRLESARDSILKKIRDVNSGNMAKASRYFQRVVPGASFQDQV